MSPAATLQPAQAQQAALQAADDLFYARGVGDVTMAEIRDQSGVSLRRLYSMYPAKSDLVAAWLRYRHEEWTAGFGHRVEQRVDQGATKVDAVFHALEDWMTETAFRGCGFINTHAEGVDLTDEHRTIIRDHKRELSSYLASMLPNGRAVAVLVDGAIVQAAIFASADPIHLAHEAARTLTTEKTS